MAQLLVRDLESAVVNKLRHQAATQGVSVEEAHRRLLRAALLGWHPGAGSNFIDYLRRIPAGGQVGFPRARDLPRKATL